ncbi:MAG TPA: hypothetical protein DD733_00135 [Clostridiales bacterium]|nr:hypothetical protein [Eubacteriales bacterium]HBR30468.1 hypothetical protein [Clostridiales bacterium]
MFIVKENFLYGEDYIEHTAADEAAVCFMLFTGKPFGNTAAEPESINRLFEEMFGFVKRCDGFLPAYEIVCLHTGKWRCNRCLCTVQQYDGSIDDFIRFFVKNKDGDIMGNLYRPDINDTVRIMELLDNGACPVCDGWEDGLGNTCSPQGWGKTEFFFKDFKPIGK